jgi:hypothetical protein
MSRFTPSLHPRDRKGKFRGKGGGGSGKGVGRSGARTVNRTRKIASNVKASRAKASDTLAKRPLSAEASSVVAKRARQAEIAVAGLNVASGVRSTAGFTAGAVAAGAAQQHVLAASLGAKAVVSGAYTLNEAHLLKTLTSKNFPKKNVEELSKFQAGYAKRSKVIQRAQSATTIVGLASIAGAPLIKAHQDQVSDLRRNVDSARQASMNRTGNTVFPKGGATNLFPKASRQKRSGVYDITTAKGKRVA